jgi:hypothetical protein
MDHCPGCHGHVYDERDGMNCDEHDFDVCDSELYRDCPGCGHDALKSQLAEARANARILAHCYLRDCRPPDSVMRVSADYPVEEKP